ncbi:MAG: DUF3848 domain-containing protein [Clostridia bacterium]
MEDKVQEKLEQELKQFKQEVKEMGVDVAIDRAYELTVKQEIIDGLSYDNNLSKKEINATLSCKKPLQKIYDDWLTQDGTLEKILNFSIDKSVNSLTSSHIKRVKEARESAR